MVEVLITGGLMFLSYYYHSFIPVSVSCVGVLLESHISFHIWLDESLIILNIFTCGINPLLSIVPELRHLFEVSRKSIMALKK